MCTVIVSRSVMSAVIFNDETSQNMNRTGGQLLNLQEREIITAALILYVHYILDYICCVYTCTLEKF